MSPKISLWNFIMSQEFITFLTGVIAVVNGINIMLSILSGNYPNLLVTAVGLIILILLLFLTYNRWKIKHSLALIEKYKFLMNYLERLSRNNFQCNVSVMQFLNNQVTNKKISPSWKYYFDTHGADIDTKFNNLNAKIDKLISVPYRFNRKKMYKITREFWDVVNGTKKFYERYVEMLKNENISKSFSDFGMVKKTYDRFISALDDSREDFEEIKNEFTDDFCSLLPDPNQ